MCERPDCLFHRRELGCGYEGAPCGSTCDDGLPCEDESTCPDGEICAEGKGPLTDTEAADVCMPPACLVEPQVTGCGSSTDLCGKCECTTTCASKHCGDDPFDGCGSTCRSFCGPRDQGCTGDPDCPADHACIVGGGPRIGLAEGINVCLPLQCISPNPEQQQCGQVSSPCGLCPELGDVCGDRQCGVDPSYGASCSSSLPPTLACVGGIQVTSFQSSELDLSTRDLNTGAPRSVPPLPVAEEATEVAPGALPGSFDVSDRGTATYTVPITVPPGRNGLQPELSLRYSGGQANGSVGLGWAIGGLSSIARCPKSPAIDGWNTPVQYDASDDFCLDGQRLILVEGSGEHGATGSVYRTEIDSLDRVQLFSGLDGLPYFHVSKKDGRIFLYGHTANSRIYRDLEDGIVRVWGVSRISDRVGNSISFEYGKFESSEDRSVLDGGEPIVDIENQTIELFLRSVSYGGHLNQAAGLSARREVHFEYTPYRFDYMDGSTRGGARVARTQLLTKVTTSLAGATVHSYELEYGGVPVPGLDLAETHRTKRLKSLRECAHKHGARVCKRPTTFDYSSEQGLEATGQPTTIPSLAPAFTGEAKRMISLDWNADGREDLLANTTTGDWTLLVSTGSRTGAAFTEVAVPLLGASSSINQNSVADLNGDGRDDLFQFGGGEGRFSPMLWSTADPSSPFFDGGRPDKPAGGSRAFQADLNGDGFMDVFLCDDQNNAHFMQRTADGLDESLRGEILSDNQWGRCFDYDSQTPDDPMLVQDIDGDGAGEVLMYKKPVQAAPGGSLVTVGNWARYVVDASDEYRASWQPIGLRLTARAVRDGAFKFIDVNGDGLKDIYYLDDDVARTPLIDLNYGGRFGGPREAYYLWSEPSTRNGVLPTVYSIGSAFALDYEGDGSQDLVRRFDAWAAGTALTQRSLWQWDRSYGQLTKFAALATDPIFPSSTTFKLTQPGVTPPEREFGPPAVLADVDGDGSQDLVQLDKDGVLWVHHGKFNRESLLKTVIDGLGKRLDIRYDAVRPAAGGGDQRVYTPVGPAGRCRTIEQNWNTRCIHNPGPLVSDYQVSFESGPGTYQVDRKIRLSYENAREGMYGRGWYGFGRRITEELAPDDSLIRQTDVLSDVRPLRILANHLAPFAGREVRRTVSTAPDASELEAQPAFTRITTTNEWEVESSALGGVIPFVEVSTRHVEEVTSGGDIYSVLEAQEVNEIDELGNSLSSERTIQREGVTVDIQGVTTTYHTGQDRRDQWLISLPHRRTVSDYTFDSGAEIPFLERVTEFDFDELGLPLQIIRQPDQFDTSLRQVTTFNRLDTDPTRRIQSIKVSGGWSDGPEEIREERITSFEYDTDVTFPTRVKRHIDCNPDGTGCDYLVTDVRYDPRDGTLLGVVDPTGVGSQAGYDSFGRLLIEKRASGTTTLSYANVVATTVNGRALAGKLKIEATNGATGAKVSRTFDSLGRTVQTSTSGFEQASILQEFGYEWGNLLSYASRPHLPGDASQGAITQTYDERWRVERRIFPDTTYVELASGKVGNLRVGSEASETSATAQRDRNGHWTYAFGDFRGSTRRTVDQAGSATRYAYDAFGTLSTIIDPQSNITRLQSDRLGRLIEHEDADTGTQTYSYTAFDQLFKHIDGYESELRVRKHTYDSAGRLVALDAPEGESSFAYDGLGDNARGRLAEMTSPSGATEHYVYQDFPADGDPMKNLGFVDEVSRLIDGTTFTTQLDYDPTTHQLSRVEYPSSAQDEPFAVRYAYDAFGNLSSINGTHPDVENHPNDESVELWRLDEAHNGSFVKEETFGNGVKSSLSYEDLTGRLKTLVTRGPSNVVLQSLSYGLYDGNGNLKQRTSTFKRVGSTTTDTYSESFNYDALDRLDDYTVDGVTSDLEYNSLGNITFKTGVGLYDYFDAGETSRPHAVQSLLNSSGNPVAEYDYDDYGNIQRRSGEGVAGGTQQFVHTSFNLPSTVTLGQGAGAQEMRYEYDATQQRVSLAMGDCSSDNNPTCNKRIYIGGNYERQRATDAGGSFTRHSYKVFAGSRQVAQIEREQRSGATIETRRFIHADHLGSSQLFTNAAGELTGVQRLDPFGAPADTPSGTPDAASARIRAGFTGHETDVETGLVNMGGRLYDPRIGRVMQADPPFMESPHWSQGLNRYSYVFNNPLNALDPTGFTEEHDHAEDADVDVWQSTTDEGLTAYEQPPIAEGDHSSSDSGSDEESGTSPASAPDDDSLTGDEEEGVDDVDLSDYFDTPEEASLAGGVPYLAPDGQPLRFWLGTENHNVITDEYVLKHPNERVATNNVPLIELVGPLGGDASKLGQKSRIMPDITNLDTREVYEIKPVGWESQASQDLANYLDAFKNAGAPMIPGGPSPGTSGVHNYPSGAKLEWGLTAPGIIVYQFTYPPPPLPIPLQLPNSKPSNQRGPVGNPAYVSGGVLGVFIIVGGVLLVPEITIPALAIGGTAAAM